MARIDGGVIQGRALRPGERIGGYEVLVGLRAGGMATLFLGRKLGPAGFVRNVAVKVIHPHLSSDKAFVQMFLDEARISARIQHPNVVRVEALGEEDGLYYMIMEFVEGCSLSELLVKLVRQRRFLDPAVAVHIVAQIASGLHAAHELANSRGEKLGIVHRDVSPSNVLLDFHGHVKLIDFGIAKVLANAPDITRGTLKGKLRYMAPEHAAGKPMDHRSDIYSLALVLWETLTLRRAIQGKADHEILLRAIKPDLQPPSDFANVPAALSDAVMEALSVDPAQRPVSAMAFRRRILDAVPGALNIDPSDLGSMLSVVMPEVIDALRKTLSQVGSGDSWASIPAQQWARGEEFLEAHTVVGTTPLDESDAASSLADSGAGEQVLTSGVRSAPPAGEEDETVARPGRVDISTTAGVVARPRRTRLWVAVLLGLLAGAVVAGVLWSQETARAPVAPSGHSVVSPPSATSALPPQPTPPTQRQPLPVEPAPPTPAPTVINAPTAQAPATTPSAAEPPATARPTRPPRRTAAQGPRNPTKAQPDRPALPIIDDVGL